MSEELVTRYFALAPGADREAYFAQFAPDAVVEDEGRERHGIQEIRAWRTEVVPVTYTVTSIGPDGDGELARARIAGDFPGSPVTLGFRFTFAGGRISSLVIRP
jgi:hypothetical protein